MRTNIRELAEFVGKTVDNNLKFGMETNLIVNCKFDFGRIDIIADPDDMEFAYKDNFFAVRSSSNDKSGYNLEIQLTDAMEILIDKDSKMFDVVNRGVTGILNNRIHFELIGI